MELWLPPSNIWNGKFKGVGSGGLGGTIPHEALARSLEQGFAVAATDTGHDNRDGAGAFALAHPEKIVDYGFRAIHLTALTGKELTEHYYRSSVKYAYFEGCSQGGQEALMEAQRYPGDYDGIIAGDPDYNQTHHEVGAHLWVVSTLYSDPSSRLSATQAQLIGDAVSAACDRLDGVEDGVLEDPRRCHFDPGVLQCRGESKTHCLTPAQVVAVRKLWDGPAQAIDPTYYPGLERGAEATLWKNWIIADTAEENVHGMLGLPFFRYFVFSDPNWDFRTFDYRRDSSEIDRRFASTLNAVDPDLLAFATRGGKLIQYHGFNDPDVPPRSSILYHDAVQRSLRGKQVQLRDFYRLFMVPGMGHCGGGPGANSFDMMGALERWVEQGIAPSRIIATKYANDDPSKLGLRTHPLCPYPEGARFLGSGSLHDERNFACVADLNGNRSCSKTMGSSSMTVSSPVWPKISTWRAPPPDRRMRLLPGSSGGGKPNGPR
jgi:feruloyl esterase